ncbi:MAG: hypothetical protein EGP81_08680 [Bacteroides clarus]|uniref:hypothetical protein n=1 Tax=Bacteroides clarus TaxID=626929 RepID=UPI00241F3875|nr:hypothetical protein [Bacteroides clarus]MBD9145615.1 hypothetical protein [Bacteroides clarus]
MEKLKEDYISIDTSLEYMEAIAIEYIPDVDIDPSTGERYICGTTALPIFIRRYNQNELYGNFTYEEYIAHEDIQNTLKGLGVDIDKFWFLLLFIFDYTCGTCLDGMKATGIGIEQLTKFAKAIADNHKEINQFGVSFKKPITISVKVEGKHQIVIDNANAIGYLATTIINNLKEIEEHPWMQSQQVSMTTNAEEKESVQIWLFYKIFNDFFNLSPYDKLFNVRQKKGSTISLSKTLLISRLIYFTKLSTNKNFSEDEFTLKGYIKQYKDKRIDTVNSIYF